MKPTKLVMRRKEFIRETGYPETLVDRAVKGKYGPYLSFRISDAPNSPIMIKVPEFLECIKDGSIK